MTILTEIYTINEISDELNIQVYDVEQQIISRLEEYRGVSFNNFLNEKKIFNHISFIRRSSSTSCSLCEFIDVICTDSDAFSEYVNDNIEEYDSLKEGFVGGYTSIDVAEENFVDFLLSSKEVEGDYYKEAILSSIGGDDDYEIVVLFDGVPLSIYYESIETIKHDYPNILESSLFFWGEYIIKTDNPSFKMKCNALRLNPSLVDEIIFSESELVKIITLGYISKKDITETIAKKLCNKLHDSNLLKLIKLNLIPAENIEPKTNELAEYLVKHHLHELKSPTFFHLLSAETQKDEKNKIKKMVKNIKSTNVVHIFDR